MNLTKSETNNAIVTRLQNVREHPNADRLKLATVLGTQVIVGLDAKENDLVIYFDSNLSLSHDYLSFNNLYSSAELNKDTSQKGYFGKNGRVRAQKFRGEVSNGYVADIWSAIRVAFDAPGYNNIILPEDLKKGDEFTHINGVKICEKYIIPQKGIGGRPGVPRQPISDMFHKHWDTKQLMREWESIPEGATCCIEEKIHGTSGRTGFVLCDTNRGWKFWKPKQEWKVVSGTRRVDNVDYHLPEIRKEIERKVTPHLHKGETIFYEIYGYDDGKQIQAGYPYDCKPGEWKCLLYRVTITTPDGFTVDLDRCKVYKRAEELGLEKPYEIHPSWNWEVDSELEAMETIKGMTEGKSRLDCGTLCEGIVIWFINKYGNWDCLKLKSEEFLLDQDKRIEKEQGDIEDSL